MNERTEPSRITLVEQQKRKKHRYNIYLDDEYAFSVHEDVLVKHRLSKGSEVDASRLQNITRDEERQKAFIQAIRFISRKPRSQQEIEKKLLEKEYDLEIIHEVIQKMKEQQYLDDQDFAHTLTEYRIHSQKKGRKWVRQELFHKGVSKEFVEKAIEQIDEDAEERIAYELAHKRWIRQSGELRDKKRKVGEFLLRRGYTHSVVQQVLRTLQGNESDDEEDYP